MRFTAYLRGERLILYSDLPPNEVAGRLRAMIGGMWTPFETGVIGWVGFGHFVLRFQRSAWFRREALPVLVGRLRRHDGGSRITMLYRAPRLLLILFALWAYLLLLFIWSAGVLAPFFEVWLFIGALSLLLGMIGLSSLLEEADGNLAEMLVILEEAAGPRT